MKGYTRNTHRKLTPVKYMKKRARRCVAPTMADLERIQRNAEMEAADKAARETNRNYNF